MLFLLQEGFFEFVEGDAVEGEVFRALAEAGPDDIHTKISQGYPKQLSWVQCERTERIRRSPPGD